MGTAEVRAALLRGINVGGRHRVPMTQPRDVLGDAGFGTVTTLATSGNVIFDDGPPDESVCAHDMSEIIEATFGFAVPVVIRATAELEAALRTHPFAPPRDGDRMLHIVFCGSAPDADAVTRLDPDRDPHDRWAVVGREVHVRYGRGSARSKITVDWLERELGVQATSRNVRTVAALAKLARDR